MNEKPLFCFMVPQGSDLSNFLDDFQVLIMLRKADRDF